MDNAALQQLCEAVPVPMLVVDGDARVVVANAAATTMLGEALTNRPFVTVLRQALVNRAVEQALAAAGNGALSAAARTLLTIFVLPAAMVDTDGRGMHDRATGTAVILG